MSKMSVYCIVDAATGISTQTQLGVQLDRMEMRACQSQTSQNARNKAMFVDPLSCLWLSKLGVNPPSWSPV